MYRLIFVLILGVSLTYEQTEAVHLKTSFSQWAEKTISALATEVKETAAHLQELAQKADSPRVMEIVQLHKQNQNFLNICQEEFGTLDWHKAAYCINITGDIASITQLLMYGYELAINLGTRIAYIVNELNNCSQKPIWKQYSCYKQAFSDIQDAIKTYSYDCNQFLQNATTILQEIEIDITGCFAVTESINDDALEKKIDLCKQKLYKI